MRPNVQAFALILFSIIFSLSALPSLAQPVGTVDLQFSVDGGTTFTDTATVDDKENFILRINFENTGDASGTAASLATSLPAGFTRVAGTTRVCLEPTPGEIVCNTDAGQGGMIDEPTVWSGQDLAISPTAGLFGQGVGLTTGTLEFGKQRYLNLHDCHYFNGAERFFVTADPDISGTNISDTIDAAAACAGSEGAYGLAGAELRTVDLLANRYLNYHECHYFFFSDHIIRVTDGTATRASNTLDAAFNCAGTAGAHILDASSEVTNFDLFSQRYLNLWECRAAFSGDVIAMNSIFGIGSNTSSTPDAAPACPGVVGDYSLIDSDLLALDTLDTTRGHGFVEVEVRVSSGAGVFDLDASLAAAEFATEMDTGSVTVAAVGVPTPAPSIDLVYARGECSNVFRDTVSPFPGDVLTTRIYFDNMGDAVGTGSSITTTVPNGYTLVPNSTRVCLEPASGETVCNDDAGQGGAIDEGAVWSGQTLTIAPTAGLQGESPAALLGNLEIGRKRYLNFHECHYSDNLSDRLFLTVDQAGTNVSNTADVDPVCGAIAHGRPFSDGNVTNFDLLTGRFFNVHECQYSFLLDRIFIGASGISGSNVSNTADASLSCAATAGAHTLLPAESNLKTLDLSGNRYLNLHECVLLNGADHVGLSVGPANGTNVSNTEDALVVCPSSSGAHVLVAGSVAALDLLDTTRGRGYVEFQVTGNGTPGTFDQSAELSGNEFTTETDMGQILAPTGPLFRSDFECGNANDWSMIIVP